MREKKIGYWWEGSTTTAMPVTSAYVIGQHNKIEIPTFNATIIIMPVIVLFCCTWRIMVVVFDGIKTKQKKKNS